MTEFEKRVYAEVRKIPCGEVRTYKDIAAALGNPHLCRAVGNALHKNPSPGNAPCHRVVNSELELAKNYAFGGADAQRQFLESEGVVIKDNKVVINSGRE